MSIAYQCWEMGVGSTVGYSKGSSLPQYVTENNNGSTTLRCLSSPSSHHHHHHEASFVMYMQQHQPTPQGPSSLLPKDMATVRFSSSSPPISATASSPTTTLPAENNPEATPPKQAAVSETNVTTSSLTSERSAEEKASDGESKRLESAGVPGTIASGSLSQSQGWRVKVGSSHAKPGVVEHIVPVSSSGLLPYGGYMYGSPALNNEHSSESSSSICQASEDSGSCSSEDTGGEEAQSVYRGPLTTMMSALDESLPIKRPGLSKFFGGKSRSFSSLAEVSTVTELAKPNNPYAKRRKMGFNCPLGDKTRSYPPPTRSSGASIAKKLPSNGSRNTLAVAVILGGLQEDQQQPAAAAATAPQPETRTFPSRSYSLTDLPHHSGSPPPLRRSFGNP